MPPKVTKSAGGFRQLPQTPHAARVTPGGPNKNLHLFLKRASPQIPLCQLSLTPPPQGGEIALRATGEMNSPCGNSAFRRDSRRTRGVSCGVPQMPLLAYAAKAWSGVSKRSKIQELPQRSSSNPLRGVCKPGYSGVGASYGNTHRGAFPPGPLHRWAIRPPDPLLKVRNGFCLR